MTIKKKFILFFVIFVMGLAISITYYVSTKSSLVLPTYFTYSEREKQALKNLTSTQKMTTASLKKWDTILFKLVKKNLLGDAPASRVYAYLYTAQRDAAFLSYNINHNFAGNLGVISANVLCLFFSDSCSELMKDTRPDPYSTALANIVLEKIKLRMQSDKNTKPYPEKQGDRYWSGVHPYYAQDVGSWKPWFLKSSDEFIASTPPPPENQEWQNQLKITKTALTNATPEQTKLVVFWAGDPGTLTPPGIWLSFANSYMWSHHVPFAKAVLVRSVLADGIADTVMAAFNSKYTYWIKRPFMLDHTIHTIMPTPNHPSYPAGHSTISATAATILSYYFPENNKRWVKDMNDASQSRVWGGIHFTLDAQEGLILGEKVGEAVIEIQQKQSR